MRGRREADRRHLGRAWRVVHADDVVRRRLLPPSFARRRSRCCWPVARDDLASSVETPGRAEMVLHVEQLDEARPRQLK
jgi:hypothetical protein